MMVFTVLKYVLLVICAIALVVKFLSIDKEIKILDLERHIKSGNNPIGLIKGTTYYLPTHEKVFQTLANNGDVVYHVYGTSRVIFNSTEWNYLKMRKEAKEKGETKIRVLKDILGSVKGCEIDVETGIRTIYDRNFEKKYYVDRCPNAFVQGEQYHIAKYFGLKSFYESY